MIRASGSFGHARHRAPVCQKVTGDTVLGDVRLRASDDNETIVIVRVAAKTEAQRRVMPLRLQTVVSSRRWAPRVRSWAQRAQRRSFM